MSDFFLREPANVSDALARDKITERLQEIRSEALLDKHTIEHWNRTHPDEEPIEAEWCDEIIAWCDGTGPLPKFVEDDPKRQRRATGRVR